MSNASTEPRRRRSQFRPCIDLHEGKVKQIVGGTLDLQASSESASASSSKSTPNALRTNFISEHPPSYYAELYRKHNLTGGHVIKLGPKNDEAARQALETWSGSLQVGGGITSDNAQEWLDAGASKVIVTSYLFPDGRFSLDRLRDLGSKVGKDKLVVDISCKKREGGWVVAMNGWKTLTDTWVNQESIRLIEDHCSELLIHAADVEGLCQGIDQELVERLGEWVRLPCTYAGGAKDISDLELVDKLSNGKVDLTFGSSLDIFGGTGVRFEELVTLNKTHLDLEA